MNHNVCPYCDDRGRPDGCPACGRRAERVGKRTFIDLYGMTDQERVTLIGDTAMKGGIVGFLVSTIRQSELYCAMLVMQYPHVKILSRGTGPAGTILVRVADPRTLPEASGVQ